MAAASIPCTECVDMSTLGSQSPNKEVVTCYNCFHGYTHCQEVSNAADTDNALSNINHIYVLFPPWWVNSGLIIKNDICWVYCNQFILWLSFLTIRVLFWDMNLLSCAFYTSWMFPFFFCFSRSKFYQGMQIISWKPVLGIIGALICALLSVDFSLDRHYFNLKRIVFSLSFLADYSTEGHFNIFMC